LHFAVCAAPCGTNFACVCNRDCWIQIDLQSVAPGYPVGCVSSSARFLRCALWWLEADRVARSQEDVKPTQTLLATGPCNIVHNSREAGQARPVSVWCLLRCSGRSSTVQDRMPCACQYRECVRRHCVRVGDERATARALQFHQAARMGTRLSGAAPCPSRSRFSLCFRS